MESHLNLHIPFAMSSDALDLFQFYMSKYPKALKREERKHQMKDVLDNPALYFSRELKEPEHIHVVELIVKNDNVMDAKAMAVWIKQNWFEVYILSI